MRRKTFMFLASSAVALATASAASAQDATTSEPQQQTTEPSRLEADALASSPPEAEAAEAATSADEGASIVVTGTRIARNGADAPTPVSVIGEAEIQRAAPVTIADYVNQLPALQGSTTPKTHGNTALGAGANLLNLRNLGVNRTLTLLNGRRVTPSTLTGAVDVNTLPTALVQRVDVVTGGASAAWGSDAVSGVVNFVLDTKFTGVKGSIQSGISGQGDAANVSADLSAGTSFADGRGHLLLSGNYSKSKSAFLEGRDWDRGFAIFNNPAFAAGNGQPRQLILPNSSLLITNSGLVTTGPLRGTAFDEAGQVATTAFPFGPIISGVFQSGGPNGNVPEQQLIVAPLEQGSAYARASFDLTENLTLFAEGSYGDSYTEVVSGTLRRQAADMIRSDNFFLPQSVRDRMNAAGVATIGVFSNKPHLGILTGTNSRSVLRGLAGIEAKFGDWTGSASYQEGRAKIRTEGVNNFITSRYLLAIDAVRDPVTGGPICRSTLTDPTNGCVPLNPLGNTPLTAAQSAYFIGTSSQNLQVNQKVAEASIQGPLFTLPAGEVSAAFGAEYRKESAEADADPLSQSLSWFASNFGPFSGSFNVKEVFAEIQVPIFKDSPLGQSLEVNGAVRHADYSTSGSANTWKLGLSYQPIEDLRFRVTRSRDIRAPNLNDLFLSQIINTVAVQDPFNNNATVQQQQITSGNRDLDPEVARSLTAGVVYRPSWLEGASVSVDYYDIKIKKAISTSSSQQIVNQCFAGNQLFCDAITRNAAGTITSILVVPFNAASESARGIDVEMGYRTSFLDGTLDTRILFNYVDKLEILSPSGLVTTRAGELGTNLGAAQGVPHVRALATTSYSTEAFDLQLKGRLIGGGKMEVDFGPLDVNRNDVPAIFYLDVFAGANIQSGDLRGQVFLAVDNVLDKDPPVVVSQDNVNAIGYGTNLAIYDTVGRAFRVGVRAKF